MGRNGKPVSQRGFAGHFAPETSTTEIRVPAQRRDGNPQPFQFGFG
jgi:hypothetical protein